MGYTVQNVIVLDSKATVRHVEWSLKTGKGNEGP